MKNSRPVLLLLFVTISLLSAVTAVFHWWLPYICLAGFYVVARLARLADSRYVRSSVLLASLAMLPVSLTCCDTDGFTFIAGPFYAQDFGGKLSELNSVDSVEYGSGVLISYARTNQSAPVLAYISSNEVRWASELVNDMEPPFTNFVGMKISSGIIRDKLEFHSPDYKEPGWAYVWKVGRVQKFFIWME